MDTVVTVACYVELVSVPSYRSGCWLQYCSVEPLELKCAGGVFDVFPCEVL